MASEERFLSSMHSFAEMAGISDASKTPLKFLKPRILDVFGFKTIIAAQSEKYTDFNLFESTPEQIHQYVRDGVGNSAVTMRFINDGGRKAGGYPIHYCGTVEEYDESLLRDGDQFVGWKAIDERVVLPEDNLMVQVIERTKSDEAEVTGLVQGTRKVRLGGGFRMQLDRVSFDPPGFSFDTTLFSNEIGPRCANLQFPYDMRVPRTTILFDTEQTSNGLIKPVHVQTENDSKNAKDVAHEVMSRLFQLNGIALSRLVNALMDYAPQEGMHALDGIYSYKNGELVNLQIIDIEGIDIMDIWKDKNPANEVLARLNAARLAIMRDSVSRF